jgi:hypothetical protein
MVSQPGVGRDGSRLSQRSYLEAIWCRFYQSLPRKMGGFAEQLRNTNGIVRAIDIFSNDGFSFVNIASGNAIQSYAIDNMSDSGTTSGLVDRTPVGYVANPAFNWQFSEQYDIPTDTTLLFASGTPSASSITTSSEWPVYWADPIGTARFVAIPDGALFTASITGTTMTVTAMSSGIGSLYEEVDIFGSGVAPGTTITAVTTDYSAGPPVVPGVYTVTPSQTVTSRAMSAHQVRASGGCCASGYTLFTYGHDGIVQWSAPNNPLDFLATGSGDARPVGDKIVRGLPIRGQSGPAVIMWSLSSVILGQFVGTPLWWDFTTVTASASVLSSNGFVEQDGIYYWATTSGFSMFNGVVRDLPNFDNKQWFLDNLNWKERQKVFAMKVPRWSELWWCFPRGASKECNWAVVYNLAEKRWYDTPLPNGGRSAGYYEFVYQHPIMAGIQPNPDTSGGYSMWQHEFGKDEVSGAVQQTQAITSSYTTSEFSMVEPQQPGQLGVDQGMSYSVLEPDFEQKGDLHFTVISRANARGKFRVSDTVTIAETPTTPKDQIITFKWSGRFTSFKIESNTAGGDYFTGAPLIHWQPGDARRED